HYHPLSSFSWKVLIALYEGEVPFEKHVVDLGDPKARAAFERLWPLAKIPVLRDDARGETLPETSIIIEHLARYYRGCASLVPSDPEIACEVRLRDRIYDLHISVPMQKIVTDHIRPEGKNDPFGVDDAKRHLAIAYGIVEDQMRGRTWAAGDAFTMADCA